MKEFLNTVKYNGRIYRQSIELDSPGNMELTVNETNERVGKYRRTIKFSFNLSQPNPNSMELDISGDEIVLELRTKKGRNGSKTTWEKLWDNLEAQVGEVASLKLKLPPSLMQKDILASF